MYMYTRGTRLILVQITRVHTKRHRKRVDRTRFHVSNVPLLPLVDCVSLVLRDCRERNQFDNKKVLLIRQCFGCRVLSRPDHRLFSFPLWGFLCLGSALILLIQHLLVLVAISLSLSHSQICSIHATSEADKLPKQRIVRLERGEQKEREAAMKET